MVTTGALDKLIQIQSVAFTTTGTGTTQTPSNLAGGQVWAAIRPTSGKEFTEGSQISAEATHLIDIWYLSTVTPNMQCTFSGRTFNFISVLNPKERNEMMTIVAKEEV